MTETPDTRIAAARAWIERDPHRPETDEQLAAYLAEFAGDHKPDQATATAWTDPETGATYDLAQPLLDAEGDYWHHIGWLTPPDGPIPLVMWSPSPDRALLGTRWADVSVLIRVIEDCGPLEPAPAAGPGRPRETP